MIDFIDIFDVYQQGKIAGLGSLQADTDRRVTSTVDKLRNLEQRYERMSLVTNVEERGKKEEGRRERGEKKGGRGGGPAHC